MRMIFTQHFTDNSRRLFIRRIRADAHVVHRVEDAALHRLESIARIGQGARHDDAHRIIEVCLLHFGANVYFSDETKFHSEILFEPLRARKKIKNFISAMSLRAAALDFWRRSNLHLRRGLLRAKNKSALATT